MGSNSYYIKSIIKSPITSCIKVTTRRSKLNHIKYVVLVVATSDNKVTITRVESNLSINSCTIINRGIKRTIINFVYNRKLNNASI